MSGETHRETLTRPYTFPEDVKVVPASELAEHLRAKIGAVDGDFAVTRPGHRSPSRMVDLDTLELLQEFVAPTPIGEAIARFAHRRGLDPEAVLQSAFPVLQSFTESLLLVPEDSVFADGVVASFVTGQLVAGYEIRRLVQVLRDTEVYLARGPDGADVALKVARAGSVETVRPMLEREADILEHLGGTGSPRLEARVLEADIPFVSMEWLPGVSASARAHELRTASSPDWRRRLHEVVARLIGAYHYLHALDVVHADVHSGNVVVDESDRIKLLDFGLARLVRPPDPHDHKFRTGFSRNMEPEAALALRRDGIACGATKLGEQYSVASLAYTLLCGEHYAGPSAARETMIHAVVNETPLPFARHGWESWPAAERVLARGLAKEPEDRFASMEEFLEAWHETSPPDQTPRRESRFATHPNAFERLVDVVLDWTVPTESLIPDAPAASVQYGAAGLAYFLYRASLLRESPHLLSGADRWSRCAVAWIDSDTAFDAPQFGLTKDRVAPDSLFHSAAGAHVVAWPGQPRARRFHGCP